ncbi:MAG: hypothetical protein AAGC55_15835, partial [Myxococcota bacterium]
APSDRVIGCRDRGRLRWTKKSYKYGYGHGMARPGVRSARALWPSSAPSSSSTAVSSSLPSGHRSGSSASEPAPGAGAAILSASGSQAALAAFTTTFAGGAVLAPLYARTLYRLGI